jgi:hypothetical protein
MRLRRRHVVLGLLGVLVTGAVVAFANTLTVTSGHLDAKSTATSLTTTTAPNLTPNFLVTAPATTTAGAVFNVTVQARLGTTIDPTFTGTHCVTFSGPGPAPGNTAPAYPEQGLVCAAGQSSVTFDLGAATVPVTLFKAESIALTANATLRTGTSGTIAVNSAGVTLTFSTTCPATHPKGTTQTYTLNIPNDSFSNPFTSTTGLMVGLTLTGADSANYKFVATQSTSHSVTFATGNASSSFAVNAEGAKKNATMTATPSAGSGFTGASCSLVGTN